MIKGISVLNPVDVEKEYLEYTVDYAIKNGYDHFQLIGPIHNYIKGNIDGMIYYRKYERFNEGKDFSYIDYNMKVVNEAFKRTREAGIKTYMWHHELFLPSDFCEVYPEVLNDCGDIEVTAPAVKDFLENKIIDFFDAYPLMDGIILTLHETQIPLLKLKNQKLSPIERVKYVTKILFDTCVSAGKELIVRNFASLEEDNEMMTKAYEEISKDMFIMDKWTQFDWSLTMPGNPFYSKIKNNPLFVETDIFGEYFGKGRVPILLDHHIKKQFNYCENFNPVGYVSRIDRNGQIPFGDVNEVNIGIMKAYLDGTDPEEHISRFFEEKYPDAAKEVRELMAKTEEILTKTIYIKDYLFSELSIFPALNHCKNHFYFEMMKKDADIFSDEWFIPKNWNGCSHEEIMRDKEFATEESEKLFKKLLTLKDKIEKEEFEKLYTKFANLMLIAKAWYYLAKVHISYVLYFEKETEEAEAQFRKNVSDLNSISEKGYEMLGDKFYCRGGDYLDLDYILNFTSDVLKSFDFEKEATARLKKEKLTDFIVCAGGLEGHRLKKEVNFSDTFVLPDGIARIPGNRKGEQWSAVNSHGWFSYEITVKPNSLNTIEFLVKNPKDEISMIITLDGEEQVIKKTASGKTVISVNFEEKKGKDKIRLRVDRNSAFTPYLYEIKVL